MSHERIWGFLSSRYTNFLIIIIIIIIHGLTISLNLRDKNSTLAYVT